MDFIAKYRGTCENCDNPVEPGQKARYVWGELIAHVVCPPKPTACPRCFLVHAGECF